MSDSSETESDVELPKAKEKERYKVNNVPALNAKLSTIQLKLDWVEKLDIAVDITENENILDATDNSADSKAENDFKREMSFYNQALQAVSKAFKRLHKQGIPTRRPADFFAEMAKSDSHMNKVREKLLSKQTAVERRDQVRAIREQKKQGKKLQQQILAERKSEKKKMLNALKKTKKGKMDADALLGLKKENPAESKKGNSFAGKKNNFKRREMKNQRYGYGGKKRNSKWNTAESSSSVGKFGSGMKHKGFKDKKFGKAKRRRR